MFSEYVIISEGNRQLGKVNALGFLSGSSTFEIRGEQLVLKSTILKSNQVQVYNRTQERLLTTVKLELLN